MELALASELAEEDSRTAPGRCFSGHSRFDVLRQGQKIAGAAQRRRRDGLLIQGSLQAEGLGIAREAWQRAFLVVGEREGIDWVPFESEALTGRVNELCERKYSQKGYNEKR
jgi:lipoate-protein ligase A